MQKIPPGALVMADRAYDTDAVRQHIQAGKIGDPEPRARQGPHGQHAVALGERDEVDPRRLHGLRDHLHGCVAVKHFRRIATRYDKLASSFLTCVQLAAAVIYWL